MRSPRVLLTALAATALALVAPSISFSSSSISSVLPSVSVVSAFPHLAKQHHQHEPHHSKNEHHPRHRLARRIEEIQQRYSSNTNVEDLDVNEAEEIENELTHLLEEINQLEEQVNQPEQEQEEEEHEEHEEQEEDGAADADDAEDAEVTAKKAATAPAAKKATGAKAPVKKTAAKAKTGVKGKTTAKVVAKGKGRALPKSIFPSLHGDCPLVGGQDYIPAQAIQSDLDSIRHTFIKQLAGMLDDWKAGRDNPVAKGGPAPYDKPYAVRGQHVKSAGCVKANFVVTEDLPAPYNYGIFAQGKSFPSWIRISNGPSRADKDSTATVRGIAIKLSGVSGARLSVLPGAPEEKNTQDFILATGETLMVDAASDYVGLLPAGAGIARNNFFPLLQYVIGNGVLGPIMTLKRVKDSTAIGADMKNPFIHDYFSQVPYYLGPADSSSDAAGVAVKYKINACPPFDNDEADDAIKTTDPVNYIRDYAKGALGFSSQCLEFRIQTQGDACDENIEVQTKAWKGEFIKVAEIHIPKQDFDHLDQWQFCEALSFNPFHTLVEHKPISTMAAARLHAYSASATTRFNLNAPLGMKHVEPTGRETFTGKPYPSSS